eukprot:3149498-Rhodomonas_salina.1
MRVAIACDAAVAWLGCRGFWAAVHVGVAACAATCRPWHTVSAANRRENATALRRQRALALATTCLCLCLLFREQQQQQQQQQQQRAFDCRITWRDRYNALCQQQFGEHAEFDGVGSCQCKVCPTLSPYAAFLSPYTAAISPYAPLSYRPTPRVRYCTSSTLRPVRYCATPGLVLSYEHRYARWLVLAWGMLLP